MELDQLKLFVAVAREGSVTQAARMLRLQQPTVSRAVSAFEHKVGTPLLERRARGVSLTEAGRRLFDACAPLCEQLEQQATLALSGDVAPRGTVAFGMAEVLASCFLADVQTKLPAPVVPYALVAPSDVLVERVRQGSLDFALVMHARRMPGLVSREVGTLAHVLVVARKHRRTALGRFIGSREVEDPGNRHFPTLARLKRHVPEARIACSTNSLTAHKALVLRGLGVSILPEALIAHELKTKQLVPVFVGERPAFPVLCVSRAQAVWTAAATCFVETFRLRLDE